MAIGKKTATQGQPFKSDRPESKPQNGVTGVNNTVQSVQNSGETLTTMQGVASSNVGHFLERMAQERNATVEKVSEVIAWATDGNGIIADAAQLAAKKQVEAGRIPLVMPSLGLRLAVPQPSQYVDTSSLLPPATPSESKQLPSTDPAQNRHGSQA